MKLTTVISCAASLVAASVVGTTQLERHFEALHLEAQATHDSAVVHLEAGTDYTATATGNQCEISPQDTAVLQDWNRRADAEYTASVDLKPWLKPMRSQVLLVANDETAHWSPSPESPLTLAENPMLDRLCNASSGHHRVIQLSTHGQLSTMWDKPVPILD